MHVQIDEDELPELIVQIDEQDLGDGMRAVTIQCDEGLLKAAGVDFAKIDTGFDVKLQWASRDGNTSTISSTLLKRITKYQRIGTVNCTMKYN